MRNRRQESHRAGHRHHTNRGADAVFKLLDSGILELAADLAAAKRWRPTGERFRPEYVW